MRALINKLYNAAVNTEKYIKMTNPKVRVYHYAHKAILISGITNIEVNDKGDHTVTCLVNGRKREYKFAQAETYAICIEDREDVEDSQ